jgi:thiol-disulfide isomerase/thioredoxin
MKTSSSIFLVVLILINSCTSHLDKDFKKFTLKGEIIGQDTGKIVLTYVPDETIIYDTAKINEGKFEFTGKILEPTTATLVGINSTNRIFIYLEAENLNISLANDKFEDYKMTGSKAQDDSDLKEKLEKPFFDFISNLKNQYKAIDSMKNTSSGPVKILIEKRAQEIDNLWSQTLKKIDSTNIKFVLDNSKSFISVVTLRHLTVNEVISIDSTKSLYNGLDNSLKQSRSGKYIVEVIRKKENIRIGNQAPDFKAIDLNKQRITLSQFKGKSVILLDFWASWCGPCRESIPHLNALSKKYLSKGFEIIAVSEDENRQAWIEAVSKDSTGMWYHIPYAEKWPCRQSELTNDDVYQNYFVQAIPQQILIDKSGKIIYRHVGYSEESEKSLDKQLSQIFDN